MRTALLLMPALAAGTLAGALAVAVPLAPASTPGLRRIGFRPSLPAGTRLRATLPAHRVLHVTVTLNPRDAAALAAYARRVSTPGSAVYREYLTPRQFGQRFGATAAQARAVQASLRAHGLTPGPVSANSLSIPVRATVSQLERAFSLSLQQFALPGNRTAVVASAPPAIDGSVAHSVQAVLGLDTVSAPHPLLVRPAPGAAAAADPRARAHVVTGGPQPCAAAQRAAPGQSAHTADQIASAYGYSGLYRAGDQGAGVTVAVYELEPNDPNDIATYQSCYGTHTSVSYVPVDGGAGSGAGSGEAAVDIENLIGLAPAARLIVYQGPNSNSAGPGSGPYDVFSAIINDDRAQVVSASWGQCEALQTYTAAAAENTLFQQAAVQGQSILAASGDQGSQDCNQTNGIPKVSLAVDDPASQPYVTGVGGTTLSAIGPRPTETVWNNGGSILGDLLQPGAGGGGISSFWKMPPDQLDAPPWVHVVRPDSSGSPCGQRGGYCRQVPDVSADADPATGYLVYWNGSHTVADAYAGWQGIGGTSGAAPAWAALIALADASPACGGSPIGFANPALYRAAASAYTTDYNDVRVGNNDFTGTHRGQFGAGPGYDMASGLGTPNGAALAASLCAEAARIVNPGPQRSTEQASVGLQLRGTDASGEKLIYRAAGLPRGLLINPASGRITGKPRRTGTATVTVTAHDREGASAIVTFSWVVGGRPTVSRTSLVGLARGRPKLAFTIAAGRAAPALRTVLVSLPRGLRFASTRGISVATPGGARVRFDAHLARGVLTLSPRRPAPKLRMTIAYPGIRADGRAAARARSQRATRALTVQLSVIDSASGSIRLAVKVKPGG